MPAGFATGTCKRPCGPRWACRMFGKSSLFGSDLLSLPVSSFPCSAPTWRWVEVAKARRTTLPFVPSLAIRPTDRSGLLSVRDAIAVCGGMDGSVHECPGALQHEVHLVHVTGVSVASCDFHHLETSLLCTLSRTPHIIDHHHQHTTLHYSNSIIDDYAVPLRTAPPHLVASTCTPPANHQAGFSGRTGSRDRCASSFTRHISPGTTTVPHTIIGTITGAMSRTLQDQFIDDEEEETCPLCVEEFDLDDKNFKPCPCGYQVSSFSRFPNLAAHH